MVVYLDHISCEDAMRQIPFQVVKANKLSIGLLQNIGLNVPKEIQFFLIKQMLPQNNNLSSVKSEDSNLVKHHKPHERRKIQTNIN
jgi:hypothetical protein